MLSPFDSIEERVSSPQSLHSSSAQKEMRLKARSWKRRLSGILTPFDVIAPQYRFVPLLGCAIILLNDAEFFFKQVAMFRAIEAMYCIDYYQTRYVDVAALGRDIPEKMCKADLIEKQVASTYGLIMFCRMLPCIFTAIPLGYLADKVGRRPVLTMHKVGTIVFVLMEILVYLVYPALPIWTLYISGLGALVGANFDLSLAMIFASYTDVMPSEKQRATLFYITTAMQYVGQGFFPIIAGWLINMDGKGGTPEISLFVCLATAILCLAISAFIFPETLNSKGAGVQGEAEEPLMNTSDEDEEDPIVGASQSVRNSYRAMLKSKLRTSWARFHELICGVGALNLLLLTISMFCTNTGIKSIDLLGLVQYPVVKLGWTFSDVTFITSIQAVVYCINYFVLLPSYTRIGGSFRLSSSAISLYIMLGSCFILIAGSTFLGLSTTGGTFILAMAIYTLGTGLPTVTQAYISSLVESDKVARVLAALSTFAIAGKLAATSLGPLIFGLGINSGRVELTGLLFYFCALLFIGSIVAVSLVVLRTKR
ncbi:MAG: hypothetical protein M1818_000541 [Claussenomyces sp. TS43310]|nr:MAG: hypothetical protein M1818_000541 [Claussenomyces sp. TS43310]